MSGIWNEWVCVIDIVLTIYHSIDGASKASKDDVEKEERGMAGPILLVRGQSHHGLLHSPSRPEEVLRRGIRLHVMHAFQWLIIAELSKLGLIPSQIGQQNFRADLNVCHMFP